MGLVMGDKKEYDKAIEYYKKSISYDKTNGVYSYLAHNNLAGIYSNPVERREYFDIKKAIEHYGHSINKAP